MARPDDHIRRPSSDSTTASISASTSVSTAVPSHGPTPTGLTSTHVAGEEVRLPKPPGVIRRFLATHPVLVDWVIVGCYLFGALLMLLMAAVGESSGSSTVVDAGDSTIDLADPDIPAVQPGDWFTVPAALHFPVILLTVLRIVAVAAALRLRRRFPLTGLIVVTVALIGDTSPLTIANGVALVFMVYAVPVYRSVAAGWLGYVIALGGSVFGYLLEVFGLVTPWLQDQPPPAATSVGNVIAVNVMTALWLLAVLLVGINLGNRRRYVAAIIDHAHQLARERDQRAQLAVAEERSRIAREMHDIVAHSVSVMIALSEGAAQAASVAPAEARDAMTRSAETGRTALAEMRRLLGALGDADEGGADRVPQPSLDQLPHLAQTFRDAGLDVALEISGPTSGDRGQELAIYRIVQEGLTNTLRYAGTGARAHVRVTGMDDCTRVEVRDHGAVGAGRSLAGHGAGRGLQGLAERVRMFGGTIETGPTADGGWRILAELPVSADARVTGVSDSTTPAGAVSETRSDREDRP